MAARHADASHRVRPAGWLVAVVVLVLIVPVGLVGYHLTRPGSVAAARTTPAGTRSAPAPTTSHTTSVFAVDQPADGPGIAPCLPVRVLASLENEDLVRALAAGYSARSRNVAGHCVTVTVSAQMSGDAESAAADGFADEPVSRRPTLWLPDSSAWLRVSRDASGPGHTMIPDSATSLAQSAVVVAMPAALAAAIGWDTHPPTWAQVFAAANDPQVWARLGHKDWGAFKLGKTSPLTATSGLLALAASFQASSADATGPTIADVDSSTVRAAVTRSELATSHYMSTPQHFLWHAREAEHEGSLASFLSAMIVDEHTVWNYNRGLSSTDGMDEEMSSPPHEKLVPVYPRGGVFVADSPAAILHAPWVSDADRAAAADFVRFATTAQGQLVVRGHGYRDLHGTAAPTVAATASLAGTITPRAMPDGAVLTAVQRSFPQVRKRARVLFLLDISGSMKDMIAPGLTKLRAAQDAITDALGYFESGDEIGLAAFSNVRNHAITPGLVAPVAPLTGHRTAFLAGLHALHPGAETPLYNATDSFVSVLAQGYRTDKINALVVLSDGQDESTQSETRTQLLTKLHGLHDTATPVLVFTLAYGQHADTATLTAIATATGGHFYDATDPLTVDMLLGDLVTSF